MAKVELQNVNGDVDEIDYETWASLCRLAESVGWTSPVEHPPLLGEVAFDPAAFADALMKSAERLSDYPENREFVERTAAWLRGDAISEPQPEASLLERMRLLERQVTDLQAQVADVKARPSLTYAEFQAYLDKAMRAAGI